MRYEVVEVDWQGAGGKSGATLACYIPDNIELKGDDRRGMVVVCPGGGYEVLWETEREAVALKYLAEGFAVFLLNYSVIPAQYPTQLLELAWSVNYIKKNAERFNSDPEKVFLCGFSSGGHLAANLGTCWNKEYLRQWTGADSDHKPAGVILAYPVITTDDKDLVYHFSRLIGEEPDEELQKRVSLETQVDKDTVPFFMWGTYEDPLVKHILIFGLELFKSGIPFESVIYQKGPHGISLANDVTSFREEQCISHCSGWFGQSVEWIKQIFSGGDYL